MSESISKLNGIKELYQEIILDHGKNQEIKENAMAILMMQKPQSFVIKFISI